MVVVAKINMENGFIVPIEHIEIIEGVMVAVIDRREAILRIGDVDAVVFAWNDFTQAMIEGIDTVEPIELLEALYRFQIT